jgi:hypothetical protein
LLTPPRPSQDIDKDAAGNGLDEVMDINNTTRRFEFHGQMSSIAFLNHLMKMKESNANSPGNRQVVKEFQNETFAEPHESPKHVEDDRNYYPFYASLFIDSYFKTLYYVHPILDQGISIQRCHSLWTGQGCPIIHQSFKALYFAVLSLGALTRTWTEGPINGMDRFEWTRVLFEKDELQMGRRGSLNDLEVVQAAIIMAQVCQHQLNSNLAYSYLGITVRICLFDWNQQTRTIS